MPHTSFFLKFSALIRVIRYIYAVRPIPTFIRDLSIVAQTGVEMLMIYTGGKFIDSSAELLLGNIEINGITSYFSTASFRWLLGILFLWILQGGLTNLAAAIGENLRRDVKHKANLDMMQKISVENLQEVEQRDFQELITFVPGYAIDRLYDTYMNFAEVMRNLITMVVAVIILSQTMGSTVFFLILIALPEPFVEYIAQRRIHKYRLAEVERVKFVDYLRVISLLIPNFPELRVNGIFKFIKSSYRDTDLPLNKHLNALSNRYYGDGMIMATVGNVLMFSYVIYVLFVSIARGLSIGQFKALYDYTTTAYTAAYNFLNQIFIVLDGVSYTKEFFRFMDYEGFGDVVYGNKRLGSGTPRIELLKLDFRYPDDPEIKVLEDVNIVIEPGEKVAFVGGDGSGKSSLVKTFCGLYEIVSGDYLLNGYSVRELAPGELKRKISVVFQNFVQYSLDIRSNIIISSEKVRINKKLYNKVKRVAGVDQFMKKEGLDDRQTLGKYFSGGREISPGYWQRLAIARMLYRNRSIYIMDEPFTFIDGPSREAIMKRILNFLGNNKTLIYITQNTDQLDLFDKVYYIHGGKIVESGTYNELMKKRGKFYKEAKANQ